MLQPYILSCMVATGCLVAALPNSHKLVFGQTITGGLLASAPPGAYLIGARGIIGPIGDRLIANASHIRENIVDDFSCLGRTYGYYADQSNECQVFHVCVPLKQLFPDFFDEADINHFSFICPKHTVFSQDAMVCAWSNEALDCSVAHHLYHINSNFFVPKEDKFNKLTTIAPIISSSKASITTTDSSNKQRSNGRRLNANYKDRQQLTNNQSETEKLEYGSKENYDESLEITTFMPYDYGYYNDMTTVLPISQIESTEIEVSAVQYENNGMYDNEFNPSNTPSDPKTNINGKNDNESNPSNVPSDPKININGKNNNEFNPSNKYSDPKTNINGKNNNEFNPSNKSSDPKTNIQGSVIIGNHDISYQSILASSSQNSVQIIENIDNSTLYNIEPRSDNIFSGRRLNTNENNIQKIAHTMDIFEKTKNNSFFNSSLYENIDVKENVTNSLKLNSSVNEIQTQMVHHILTTMPTVSDKYLSTTMRTRNPNRSSAPLIKMSNQQKTIPLHHSHRNRMNSLKNNESLSSTTIVSNSQNTISDSNTSTTFQTTANPTIFNSTTKPTFITTEQTLIRTSTSTRTNTNPYRSYRFTAAPIEISQRRANFRYSRPSRNKNRVQQLPLMKLSILPTSSTKIATSTASTSTKRTTSPVSTLPPVTTPTTVQTTSGSYRFTAPPRNLEVTRSWMSFRDRLRSRVRLRANYKYSRPDRYT